MFMTNYDRLALFGFGAALLYTLHKLPGRISTQNVEISGNMIVVPEDAKMAIWADEHGVYLPGA